MGGTRTQRSPGRGGFTLIELMVVAAIIVALLTVTAPAIKSMMTSNQQAQAENALRSSLLATRNYALKHKAVAGVRFQDDGRIVMVYATNAGGHDADNFRIRVDDPFTMKAVEDEAPFVLPGQFRVVSMDYTRGSGWRTTSDWWGGQEWYATTMALFSPRGRAIQGRCVFPPNWYPTASGSFGRWINTTYSFQGLTGIGVNSGGGITGVTPMTGPSVCTDFRLYDWSLAQSGLKAGQTPVGATGAGGESYTLYDATPRLTAAMENIEATALDFVMNVNTGKLIRKGADNDVEQ